MNILVDGQVFNTPEIKRGIGIYVRNVLCNMIKQSYEHNWYLIVQDASALSQSLEPWIVERLHVLEFSGYLESGCGLSTDTFTSVLQQIVDEKNIDVVWINNPLMLNVLFPQNEINNTQTIVTLYDLIPMVLDFYSLPPELKKEYDRRINLLRTMNASFLFISKATENDFRRMVNAEAKGYVTYLGADQAVFGSSISEKKQNITMYTGGYDPRKNIGGLIDAYIEMKSDNDDELVRNNKLYIVCSDNPAERERYESLLNKAGLLDDVVFTGYISDCELSDLYAKSAVFVFPSLYEGFGLPVVEAMLNGMVICSADNSSLREVGGNYANYFNAEKVSDMSAEIKKSIHQAFSEEAQEKERRAHYAYQFNWKKTAKETLDVFEIDHVLINKKRMALVTPWPDHRSGVANYESRLINELNKYFDIDVFVDDKNIKIKNYSVEVMSIHELKDKRDNYDVLLYEFGNNDKYHSGIVEEFVDCPGYVELHDYNMSGMFNVLLKDNKTKESVLKLLRKGFGKTGDIQTIDDREYPMARAIQTLSKGVIVHNHFAADQLNNQSLAVIPHPCFGLDHRHDAKEILDLRKKYGVRKNDVLIGCFGFVTRFKRPFIVIDAFRELELLGLNAKLIFFGESDDAEFNRYMSEKNQSNNIMITGYLDRDDYIDALEMTDIVINLRFPSNGESSGALCEAFERSKAVIVSDYAQFKEYPDDICWKVPICDYEKSILVAYLLKLINDKKVRETLGNNAKNYADTVLKIERIAKLYAKFFNK